MHFETGKKSIQTKASKTGLSHIDEIQKEMKTNDYQTRGPWATMAHLSEQL